MRSKIIFISLFIFVSFFGIVVVNADSIPGYTTSSDINFRDKPSTIDGAVIQTLGKGITINVINPEADVPGNGCGNPWFYAAYDGKEGYVCSTYISLSETGNTSYNRPWTSPKKAIYGGAMFVSGSYINRGQNTIYLKRFNVNNKFNTAYTNQYQYSLYAPAVETDISSPVLRKNNLMNNPYIFSIPVFDNMPESTWVDGFYTINRKPIYETLDSDFESSISGFPDSYKPYLRYLHTLHDNWTFVPFNTGLDFETSVAAEKIVSSVQNSEKNGRCDKNLSYTDESGWCTADDDTVRFYLDPRNFTSEANIFIFQDLSFSEIQNEDVLKNVLVDTFMSGNDMIDNQSYASIFVEAGKKYNVSPLYLATLSLLENGKSGSTATSGAPFRYNDKDYSGLFNFFNIGAYSSASNPDIAGLIYASGGENINNTVPISNNSSTSNNGLSPSTNFLSLLQVKQTGDYIRGYSLGTLVGSIKQLANGSNVAIKDGSGNVKNDDEKIGTGYTIEISNDGGNSSYTYVMYGDLNGDGDINSADLLKLRQHLLGTNILTGASLKSAYVNADSEINSADLLRIRQYLLGTADIGQ